MSLRSNIFLKYKNDYFLETGCFIGDGIDNAIEAKFDNIISIELAEKYYNICKNKYKDVNINIILGDSALILYDVIKNIDSKITFWLDGHYCYGESACGIYTSPLIQELEQIKKHHIKEHTIIIDDVRLWSKEKYDWPDKIDILNKVKEVNPDYKIIYEYGEEENDILVAYI